MKKAWWVVSHLVRRPCERLDGGRVVGQAGRGRARGGEEGGLALEKGALALETGIGGGAEGVSALEKGMFVIETGRGPEGGDKRLR